MFTYSYKITKFNRTQVRVNDIEMHFQNKIRSMHCRYAYAEDCSIAYVIGLQK